MMGKIVAAILVSLAAGAVIGAFVAPFGGKPGSDGETDDRQDVQRALDEARGELEKQARRIATLQDERYDLDNERAELLARLREHERGADETAVEIDDALEIEEPVADAAESSATDDGDPREGGRRERGFNNEERRQRMAEWRAEADAMMADEVSGRLGAGYADHLAALFENREYQDELRGQIRDAETEEEREVIVQEMRAAGRNNRQIMNDIQDGMLRAFVKEQALADNKGTNAVVRDLRELVDSPLFRMEGMFTGGGGGGRGGGFAGRRGGGRRGGGRR